MLICFESAIGRLKVSGLSHERSVVSPKGYCVRMRLVSYGDSKCDVFPFIRLGHSFVNVFGLTV